jgi:hypothetical protein
MMIKVKKREAARQRSLGQRGRQSVGRLLCRASQSADTPNTRAESSFSEEQCDEEMSVRDNSAVPAPR